MANADFYADGEWNFFCDLCGRKEKSSKGVKTWDNHYVCRHHKEARNPQDFVRGVKDIQTVPWSRTEPTDQYVLTCTQEGSSSIPELAMPGCMIPSRIRYNIGQPFSFCTVESVRARADLGTADCATVGNS